MLQANRSTERRVGGFLLLEVLVSALIIAGAVASAMYLFRLGFQYMEKIRVQNELLSKVPQVVSYLSHSANLEKGTGNLKLSDEIEVRWQAVEIDRLRPKFDFEGQLLDSNFEIYLYSVNFTVIMKNSGNSRNFQLYVTRYKTLYQSPLDI